jgi:hypothetical protein
LELYVDGALFASATASFTTAATNTGTLDLGRAGTGSYYGGSLDEIALYGTALSPTQVTDHYNKGHNTPPPTTTTYAYDNDGRQTGAGSNSYTWNLADRLTAATVGGSAARYSYDGDGNRLIASTGGATTNLLWDISYVLPELALERDGSSNLLRRYLIGADVNSLTTPAGTFFYHHDPIGSVTNLTDASGATQWTYSYEPYGVAQTATRNAQTAPTNCSVSRASISIPARACTTSGRANTTRRMEIS